MQRSSILAVTAIAVLAAVVAPAAGQSPAEVETALLPLPADLRIGATIVSADSYGFRTARPGHNGHFCVVDRPGDDRLSLECHPESLRSYLDRRLRLSSRLDDPARDSLITAEIRSGQLIVPTGALSRFVSGSRNPETGRPDSVWVWSEIALPLADPSVTGLPTENAGERPWLMHAGEHGAHVMIGYRQVGWKEFLDDHQ